MPSFVHLANPGSYRPGLWDLSADADARSLWRDRLEQSVRDMVRLVESEGDAGRTNRIQGAYRDWVFFLDRHLHDADLQRRYPTVHDVVSVREGLLAEHGIPDVYHKVKVDENARSIPLFADTVRDLDGQSTGVYTAVEAALWSLLAGNVFDMANPRVAQAQRTGGLSLLALGLEVRSRDLAVDGRAAFFAALDRLRHRSSRATVLVFIDNAGMDFILGVVPFARQLGRLALDVILAANERPALNDITAVEARDVLGELTRLDDELRRLVEEGWLRVASSGNATAGIDLRHVSDRLNEFAAGADLIVFEGQGRAIETTWTAILGRPSLRIATLKSPIVGDRMGWKPLDPIIDFREAGAAP